MTMANARCDEFSHHLGILGAGRLGLALASRLKFLGLDVPLWSRRYENGAQLRAIAAGTHLPVSFDYLAEVDVLFSVIPYQALFRFLHTSGGAASMESYLHQESMRRFNASEKYYHKLWSFD